MKNIKKYMMMESRMIVDRQLEGEDLYELLERIDFTVSNNKIFQEH